MLKEQRGFSLIEAMVAAVILGFGLLGAIGMQLNTSIATQYSRQRMEAVVMGKTEIEKLRAAAGVCTVSSAGPITPVQGSASYMVETTCPGPNVRDALVLVTWIDAKGLENTVQMSTRL